MQEHSTHYYYHVLSTQLLQKIYVKESMNSKILQNNDVNLL